MAEIIRVDGFTFRYRETTVNALTGVTLDIAPGEFIGVIGANGSGKSTLCNALVGLVPLYSTGRFKGQVVLDGVPTTDLTVADIARTVGLVFQNPFNQLSYATSTVEEELAYGLGNLGVPYAQMGERIARVSELLRLGPLLQRHPLELSGGQVQRVAIGSCLVMEPEVIVLDECTSQLDPLGSEEIFDIALALNRTGITIVMVDHEMERIARAASRVIALHDGSVLADGAPQEVFGRGDLDEHGIDQPDFTRLSRDLAAAGCPVDALTHTEDDAVEMVRRVLTP
ncbi:MAG: energy-coupling factor ABC transporter ATP-binding protein [Microbacterium sp.]